MNTQKKSLKQLITLISTGCLMTLILTSCQAPENKISTNQGQVVEVKRDSLVLSAVEAHGRVSLSRSSPEPYEQKLCFETPGTIKEIRVNKGDVVKEGTLLAKLDDTNQKLAVATAQYNVELAMNNLAEKVYPAILGYPNFYASASVFLRFEQAQREVKLVQEYMTQEKYKEAVGAILMAKYDIEAARDMLASYRVASVPNELDELGGYVDPHPEFTDAINDLNGDLQRLTNIQNLIAQGNYDAAASTLDSALVELEATRLSVRGTSYVSKRYEYPDTSTSLDISRRVLDALNELQQLVEQKDYDATKFAETIRMAQHDLEMGNKVLEENELIFRHGLNLKLIRDYNINLQNAMINLERAREDLRKTEILAPFDGVIVDILAKEGDQLSAVNYATAPVVHLVNDKVTEMEGQFDEMDRPKVELGQEAIISVDALPGIELEGNVAFVSPVATIQGGIASYKVTLKLEQPVNPEVKDGMRAIARIIVARKDNVLLVPERAIKDKDTKPWVWVIKDKKVERRPVTLGMTDGRNREIVSGLVEGEQIMEVNLRWKE